MFYVANISIFSTGGGEHIQLLLLLPRLRRVRISAYIFRYRGVGYRESLDVIFLKTQRLKPSLGASSSVEEATASESRFKN